MQLSTKDRAFIADLARKIADETGDKYGVPEEARAELTKQMATAICVCIEAKAEWAKWGR